MASEKVKEEKEEKEEGVNLVATIGEFGARAEGKLKKFLDAAKELQDYVRKNEDKFKRVESIQTGYGTLGRIAGEIDSIVNLDRVDALTKELEEALTTIKKRESK